MVKTETRYFTQQSIHDILLIFTSLDHFLVSEMFESLPGYSFGSALMPIGSVMAPLLGTVIRFLVVAIGYCNIMPYTNVCIHVCPHYVLIENRLVEQKITKKYYGVTLLDIGALAQDIHIGFIVVPVSLSVVLSLQCYRLTEEECREEKIINTKLCFFYNFQVNHSKHLMVVINGF